MSIKKWSQHLVRRPHIGWVVWLFPAIALVLAIWVIVEFAENRGPLIEIRFPDASGLETQKTEIRYRGITVGHVEDLDLSEDSSEVIVYARLVRQAKKLAAAGTQFWIVQPQVGFEGVRGLETLLKGPYIQMQPGKDSGKFTEKFVGTELADVKDDTFGTTTYFLRTAFAEPINHGDSVTYRGMKIGSVTNVILEKSGQAVDVKINVENKYVKLIRNNTAFWKKKAVKADLGLFGSDIEIGSFETMMKGGIALATPPTPEKIANAFERFELRDAPPKDWQKWSPDL